VATACMQQAKCRGRVMQRALSPVLLNLGMTMGRHSCSNVGRARSQCKAYARGGCLPVLPAEHQLVILVKAHERAAGRLARAQPMQVQSRHAL